MDSLPSQNDAESLNENDATVYVTTVINLLANENFKTENEKIVANLLSRLCNCYFDYDEFLNKIVDVLISNDFQQIAYDIFFFFTKSKNLKCNSMNNLFNILINYTDYSLSFATNILASPLFNSIIDFSIENQDSFLSDLHSTLINNVITVIHNVVRSPMNILNHDVKKFKEVLLKFITHDNSSKLGIISLLTLSYIIEEKEVHLLDNSINVIGLLLNKIRTVNSVDHRSGGFTVKELLNSLKCLSANDNVKCKIFSEDGLPLFFDILSRECEDDEKELTLSIIMNMCFNYDIKQSIKSNFPIDKVLEQFSSTENKQIQKNCQGISWLLNNKNEKKQCSLTDGKFDVFISYSRVYKEIILKIKSGIIASNLRVWIDDEQMIGSTIEAMASGIENSQVFIIAMSKAYFESPNCRLEAEYAFKLGKPIVPVVLQLKYKPMSWLGIIVGMKMYYEFSERRNPDESMSGVVRSIRSLKEGKPEVEELIEEQKTGACMSVMEKNVIGEKIRKWKKIDIANWLEGSSCGNLKKTFRDLDGSLLEVLLKIRDNSPEYFNHSLKQEFGMKFLDVLKFHKALNSLSSIP